MAVKPDETITAAERANHGRSKSDAQPNILGNCSRSRRLVNSSIIVVLVNSLAAFMLAKRLYYYFTTGYSGNRQWHIALMVCSAIVLPTIGLLSNTFVRRYSIIVVSTTSMWCGSIVLSCLDVLYAADCINQTVFTYSSEIVHIICGIASALFLINIVPFCLDQLVAFSSSEIATFIYWYMWTLCCGSTIIDLMHCTTKGFLSLPAAVATTIALCLLLLFRNKLIKEPLAKNPLNLILKVLKYAIKHKHPRMRSAFTYWDDKPYSRIDLGKAKYGGPFTTEQVEDVKIFFRIIAIIFLSSLFISLSYSALAAYSLTDQYVFSQVAVPQCLKQTFISRVGLITIAIGFPLCEFLCHTCVCRLCFKVRIISKIALGMIAVLVSLTSVTVIEAIKELHYGTNCTSSYNFNEVKEFDHKLYWTLLPHTVMVWGLCSSYTSILEFICTQTPYHMRGLTVAVFYAGMMMNSSLVYSIFTHYFFDVWKDRTVKFGCWFWFLLFRPVLAVGQEVQWDSAYESTEPTAEAPQLAVEDCKSPNGTEPERNSSLNPRKSASQVLNLSETVTKDSPPIRVLKKSL